MIMLKFAVYIVDGLSYQDVTILVCSDNTDVIDAYKCGRGHNQHTNKSIRHVDIITITSNLIFLPSYINTKDNLADPISDDVLNAKMSCFSKPFELSVKLQQFLTYV